MKTSSLRDANLARRVGRYFQSHSILFHFFAAVLMLWAVSLMFMLVWGFLVSVTEYRGELGFANNKARIIPLEFNFGNYVSAFSAIRVDTNYGSVATFFDLLFNSLWITLGSTVLKVLSTVCFAYVIARYHFFGRKFLYAFVVVQMMIPAYGQTAANYSLLDSMGMIDSPAYLLSQTAGHGIYFLVVHSYMVNISDTYHEAAKVEGANDWQIFGQVMLPLSRPAVLSVFVIQFIAGWNDYSTILVFMERFPTLASGLFLFASSREFSGAPIYFAGIFLAALPICVIFLVFNKMLMENLTIGGIKG